MQNKKAGFWIKLLSRLLDMLPIVIITIATSFLFMSHTPLENNGTNVWHFEKPWTFYIWGLLLIFLLLLTFIIIPLFTKGQTIGQKIIGIKVIAIEGQLNKAILKREVFFGWAWILTSVLTFVVINHTLITKYATTNKIDLTYTGLESLRIGIVSAVGSICMIVQMIIGISVLVRKDKTGLHDIYAKSSVVYKNRFVELKEKRVQIVKIIKPKVIKNSRVDWIK